MDFFSLLEHSNSLYNRLVHFSIYDLPTGEEQTFCKHAAQRLSLECTDFTLYCKHAGNMTIRHLTYLVALDLDLRVFAKFPINELKYALLTRYAKLDSPDRVLLSARLLLAGRSPQELGLDCTDDNDEWKFIASSNHPDAVAARNLLVEKHGFVVSAYCMPTGGNALPPSLRKSV